MAHYRLELSKLSSAVVATNPMASWSANRLAHGGVYSDRLMLEPRMTTANEKNTREAWNRFADCGRAALVVTAISLPGRKRANLDRATSLVCYAALKVAVKALKRAVPERRPNGEDNKSFPSEHAAECVGASMIIGREFPGIPGTLAGGLAGAVSIARIQAKKHYPRDVFAGAALGLGAALASFGLRQVVAHRVPSLR